MFVLTPQSALIIGAIGAPLLFLLSAWLTRPSQREVSAALLAGGAYALSNATWDQVAFGAGLWSYPAFEGSALLWLLYIPAGMVSGGAFGLVGWRLTRRFRRKGLALFLLGWSLWGLLHDFGGAALFASSSLVEFAPGPLPVLADGLLYAFCGTLAQMVIRAFMGTVKVSRRG